MLKDIPETALKCLNAFADKLRLYDELILQINRTTNLISIDHQLFSLGKFHFDKKGYKYVYYILDKYMQFHKVGKDVNEAKKMMGIIEDQGISNSHVPVKHGKDLFYSDNQIIFCEHEPPDNLYVIKKGKVKITKNNGKSEVLLSVLKEGDIFGELAIVSHKPRNATAISYGDTILHPINIDIFFDLVDKSFNLIKKIFIALWLRPQAAL